MAVAYLGLGANLGDPLRNLEDALSKLETVNGVDVTAVSRYYRTRPVGGPPGQPDYLNAVVAIDCKLSSRELLNVCLSIEKALGRVRNNRWGPRTVDIDLLLFDRQVIVEPELVIPHPEMRNRLFVILPLSDVAPPDLQLPPDNRKLRELLESAQGDPFFASQKPIFQLDPGSGEFVLRL